MRILVTGGAGYIGSHTAKALQRAGHEPVVLDDLSTGHAGFVRYGPLERADVCDEEAVFAALQRHAVEAVIHFAARAVVGESVRMPQRYMATNAGGTECLLAAMRRAGVQRLVFSSTAAVYGEPEAATLTEAHPLAPANPYGHSKRAAEEAVARAAGAAGLRYAVLRYFNVIGADPDGELWEAHEPETHVLPNLVRAATAGEAFRLFGTDFPTADGTAVRDYVDVNDLARVHLDALEALETRPRLLSNVGHGQGRSVRELVAAVEQAFGRRVRVREEPRREGDPPRLVADATHFRRWCPTAGKGLRPLADSLATLRALSCDTEGADAPRRPATPDAGGSGSMR